MRYIKVALHKPLKIDVFALAKHCPGFCYVTERDGDGSLPSTEMIINSSNAAIFLFFGGRTEQGYTLIITQFSAQQLKFLLHKMLPLVFRRPLQNALGNIIYIETYDPEHDEKKAVTSLDEYKELNIIAIEPLSNIVPHEVISADRLHFPVDMEVEELSIITTDVMIEKKIQSLFTPHCSFCKDQCLSIEFSYKISAPNIREYADLLINAGVNVSIKQATTYATCRVKAVIFLHDETVASFSEKLSKVEVIEPILDPLRIY